MNERMRNSTTHGARGIALGLLAFTVIVVLAVTIMIFRRDAVAVEDIPEADDVVAATASVGAVLGDEEQRAASDPTSIPTPTPINGWILWDLGPPLPPFIAEVRVSEILPVRSNTESGVVPTRDPGLPYGMDLPTKEKYLYAPVLLEVTEWLHGSSEAVPGLIISAYAGYAADMEIGVDRGSPSPVMQELAVGNEAIAYLSPLTGGSGWHQDYYLMEEADRRTTAGSPTLAANALAWYYYDGDNAVRLLSGSTLSIDELKGLIQSLGNQ